jgi:ATP-binding cassette, subfamily B, bacterial MsbA
MNRYLRLLVFAKPYRLYISLVFALATVYTVLDTSSYWFSASFLNTLFLTNRPAAVETIAPGAGKVAGIAPITSRANASLKAWTNKVVMGPTRQSTLQRVCLIIFLAFLLKSGVSYVKGLLLGFIELRVVNDIRRRLAEHILRLPMRFFDNKKSGELISILINDVGVINQAISSSFQDLVLVPLDTAVKLALLFAINWKLTLISLVLVPILGLVISTIGSSIRRKSKRTMSGIAQVVNFLHEVIPNIKIVKAYTSETREVGRFETLNQNYFRLAFSQKKLQNLATPVNEVIGAGLAVYLLWFGGSQIFRGTGFGPDDFVAYLIILFAMLQPLRKVSGLNNVIQTGVGAGERVFEILSVPLEPDHGTRTVRGLERGITLEGVSFRYRDDGPDVLSDISLEIRKGEVVAFVGPSGAGKTTLVNLIPRFYAVRSGRILFDGMPLEEVTLLSLREQIGMVTQETILFNRTVMENISCGREAISEADVAEATRVANAADFIQATPLGLHTMVGERGVNFSGGQRQRLSIARAVLKNSPVLILDEATSSLDSDSERYVQLALDNLMRDRTVLVIAHRLSTVVHADKIVVMDQGRIVAVDTHARLLATCPLYRHLYEIQFLHESEGPEPATEAAG